MARLIYACLALALGTLVAGFLVRDSSVPLFASIGLSALVLVLILVGTSRRLRHANELEDEQAELAELEIVEVDADDTAVSETAVVRQERPKRRRRPSTVEAQTQSIESIEELLDADEGDVTEIVAPTPTPARSRRKPAAATRPRGSRRRLEAEPDGPGAEDDGRASEGDEIFASSEDGATDEDGAADEAVADAEPPLTIEMPPPRTATRKPARARRPARVEREREPTAVTDRPAAQPVGLSPKVWVIPGRSRYHTQDCRFAKGDTLREVTQATAERRGYIACNVCNPGA